MTLQTLFFTEYQKNETDANPEFYSFFLKKVDELLRDNLDNENCNIPWLCTQLGMSRMQLHRQFKKRANCNSSEYIRRFRLKKAIQLLSFSPLNITQIAYDVGFSDVNYFSKSFKAEFGIVPSAWRKTKLDL